MASIQKRPNGVYRARYRDPDGKEHASHHKRKIDAQQWLDRETASIVSGQWVDPKAGEITLADYFEEWQERQVWAPATRRNARNSLNRCTFKDAKIKTIRKADVETFVKHLHDEGLAASSIKTVMRFVQMILKAATEDRLIATDPTVGVKLPRVSRAKEMVVPDVEEVGALINAAERPLKLLIALCAFAGLRRGEAIAVQLGDFDFDAKALNVQRQVRAAEGGGSEYEAPKHDSGRVVYLPQKLLDLVTDHVENFGVRGPSKWLFSLTPDGPGRGYLEPQWRDLKKKLGHDDLRQHDLRHFYASGLIASGCDVVTVQRALGHAQASITLSVYSHLWKTAEDLTRGAAAGLMDEAKIVLE
ncbi:tyrosine-type recombinase/integrase [Leucobacter tenebrionis]|uniref:tyrosine-type recombinase/integrase n=1 Tax=Leucobacter tenebrionis TaxID=2873270 RepID=UPI001CA6DCAE|nr:site-specific integrase [Leucobacter tenebrionis]QZY52709.1 site-specific integrase [Leucobacter tenebrionis]